jgi:hypothetical protein
LKCLDLLHVRKLYWSGFGGMQLKIEANLRGLRAERFYVIFDRFHHARDIQDRHWFPLSR